MPKKVEVAFSRQAVAIKFCIRPLSFWFAHYNEYRFFLQKSVSLHFLFFGEFIVMKINIFKNLLLNISLSFIAVACIITVGVMPTYAQTENPRWYFLGNNSNQIDYYLDLASFNNIDFEKSMRSIWIKTVFSNGSYRIQLEKWNCKKKQFSFSTITDYSAQGVALNSFSYRDDRWKVATPDSIAERIYKAVCHSQLVLKDNRAISRNNDKQGNSKNNIKGKFVVVNVDAVNIRESDSIEATVIGQADRGQFFELTGEKKGSWYQIFVNDGNGDIQNSPSNKKRMAWIHGNTFKFVD